MGLTLITPTGGRPEAFSLCERWIARQTYRGEVQWIVVDDCERSTPLTMGQVSIRPQPFWRLGENSQHRNILAALPLVQFDKVLIIEDDDWYAPTYLETMAWRLEAAPLVGEYPGRYYNVRSRMWMDCGNDKHASLFQTGIRAKYLPLLKGVCESGALIDVALWGTAGEKQLFGGNETVGIKGLPGRPGQGWPHRHGGELMTPDPDLELLCWWIGEDARAYREFFNVPLVSCICPTTERRREWLPRAIDSFQRQSWPNKEMWVISEDESVGLIPVGDPQVLFHFEARRGLTLGEKRNLCCEQSRGEIICHFDDDDYSAPDRISDQVRRLQQTGKEVTAYHTILVRETRDVRVVENGKARPSSGWWRLHKTDGLVTGTSLCYRREWWQGHRFEAVGCGEDDRFWAAAEHAGAAIAVDGRDLLYATNHADNVSGRVIGGLAWEELAGNPYMRRFHRAEEALR